MEFRDHIFLFEPGPQNEARSQAIIAEAKRVIPEQTLSRYGVISHHHFDHTSGLPAVVAEGITIVTHDVNKAFFEKAFAAPRTLAPDSMSKSGKKAKIEGIVGDKRVFQDDTRVVEVQFDQGASTRRRKPRRVSAQGKDSRLRGHVQPSASRQPRSKPTGRGDDGVRRQHRSIEAAAGKILSVHLAESRSSDDGVGYPEVAGQGELTGSKVQRCSKGSGT